MTKRPIARIAHSAHEKLRRRCEGIGLDASFPIRQAPDRSLAEKADPPQEAESPAAGTYLDWNNAVDAFHRMRRKAKIPRIAPCGLRHTFASLLSKAGAPITCVPAQLGHTKPTTTLRFCAKYLPEETQRFADRLAAREPVDQARPQSAVASAAKAAERGKTAPISY